MLPAICAPELGCAVSAAQEGQDYLAAMACAANYAWVNRASMTFLCRQAFAKIFGRSPAELDMHLVYDVSHNIAKARSEALPLGGMVQGEPGGGRDMLSDCLCPHVHLCLSFGSIQVS